MTIHSGKEFAIFDFVQVEVGHVLFFFLVMVENYLRTEACKKLCPKWHKLSFIFGINRPFLDR